jgi:hypothetical protein
MFLKLDEAAHVACGSLTGGFDWSGQTKQMATIFRERGYRFFFYAADLDEPIHVHVAKSGREAKFWIQPVEIAFDRGFKNHELNDHYDEILMVWNREKDKRDDN